MNPIFNQLALAAGPGIPWSSGAVRRGRRSRSPFQIGVGIGILAGIAVLAFLVGNYRPSPPNSAPPGGRGPDLPAAASWANRSDPADEPPARLAALDRLAVQDAAKYVSERRYLLHAELLAQVGRLAEAAAICRKYSLSDSLFRVHLLRQLADLDRRLGKLDEERSVLEILLVGASGTERDAQEYRLAENLAETGQAVEATTAFEAIRRGRGEYRNAALLALARMQTQSQAWEAAFILIQELTAGERYPRQEADAALLAAVHPELLNRFRASEGALAELALSLLRHRELDPAQQLLEELLQRFPDSPRTSEYCFALGRLRGLRDDVDGALAWYDRAMAGKEDAAGIKFAMARLNLLNGRDAEAARLYREVLTEAKSPGTRCDAWVHLANLERKALRPERARSWLQKGAASLTKGFRLRLLYRLAILDLREGKARTALAGLRTVRAGMPKKPGPELPDPDEIDYFTGLAKAAVGDRTGALDVWLDAVNDLDSHYANLAEAAARSLLARYPTLRSAAVERLRARCAAAVKRRRPAEAFRELGRIYVAAGDGPDWSAGLAGLEPFRTRLEGLKALRRPAPPPSLPAGVSEALRRAAVFHAFGMAAEAAREYVAVGDADFAAAFGISEARAGLEKELLTAELYRLAGDFRNAYRAGERLLSRYPAGTPRALMNPAILALAWPQAYADLVAARAAGAGVDPNLVWAVMKAESRFSPKAFSPSSARGLMQVMPDTARRLCEALNLPAQAQPEQLFDPAFSITLGVKYLADAMAEFRSPGAAAASYNAGFGPARYWNELCRGEEAAFLVTEIHIPETRRYVNKVLAALDLYSELYKTSP